MQKENQHFANASMGIRKPVAKIFEAFIEIFFENTD